MKKITCATCSHLIKDDDFPLYWCGLERTDISDVDVSLYGKPIDFQPEWCRLREEFNNDKYKTRYTSNMDRKANKA